MVTGSHRIWRIVIRRIVLLPQCDCVHKWLQPVAVHIYGMWKAGTSLYERQRGRRSSSSSSRNSSGWDCRFSQFQALLKFTLANLLHLNLTKHGAGMVH